MTLMTKSKETTHYKYMMMMMMIFVLGIWREEYFNTLSNHDTFYKTYIFASTFMVEMELAFTSKTSAALPNVHKQ
jgi:hypothetical protein